MYADKEASCGLISGKSRTSLISLISTHVQREKLELEDEGMAEITKCQMVSVSPPTEYVSQLTGQVNMLQMENEQAQLNNEQDRQQSQKNEEQARLTKEIEALQVKLL